MADDSFGELYQEVMDGVTACTNCGASIELDCEECGECGKPSKFIEEGWV